jgi:hypothetical protein
VPQAPISAAATAAKKGEASTLCETKCDRRGEGFRSIHHTQWASCALRPSKNYNAAETLAG